jgi:hypothetical protein
MLEFLFCSLLTIVPDYSLLYRTVPIISEATRMVKVYVGFSGPVTTSNEIGRGHMDIFNVRKK